jgi:hypothetical protein
MRWRGVSGPVPSLILAAVMLMSASPALADNNGGVEPVISESSGCGIVRVSPPLASHQGWLANSEPVRGPFGALFGRTIGQVRQALVRWKIPMSSSEISVHSRALPAFNRVTANLSSPPASYQAKSGETFGYAARTVSGRLGISYHAFGAAVDINSRSNPHSTRKITDMPAWFVQAWRDAGFCWGGDWTGGTFDTMHYSWMGPAATPGYGPIPAPYPSLAAPANFSQAVPFSYQAAFGARRQGASDGLADLTGNGSIDAVRVRSHAIAGPIVEVMAASADFTMCGLSRFTLPGANLGRPVVFTSTIVPGRPDVVFLDLSGSNLSLQIYPASNGYQQPWTVATGAAADSAATYLFADHNRDGKPDLFVIRGSQLEVFDAATNYSSKLLSATLPMAGFTKAALGDRDLDGRPDLYLITGNSLSIALAAGGYTSSAATFTLPVTVGSGDIVRISDYDGDGHGDLYRLDPEGRISVLLGNQQIYSDIRGWFRDPGLVCGPNLPVYDHQGRFADDDSSPFQADIEWLAAQGITAGCNPPFSDFFCPTAPVTREQMATFISRALGLPAVGRDYFTDDTGSPHEADINRLAAAGITSGCAAGRFCPGATITREQMATFLYHAFALAPAAGQPFADVSGGHAPHVAAIYQAGITAGCASNPLRYCPTSQVTREQMAAFLHRASSG